MIDSFKFPWRVEVRASLFHPWRPEGVYTRLAFALGASSKYNSRFVRIRAN